MNFYECFVLPFKKCFAFIWITFQRTHSRECVQIHKVLKKIKQREKGTIRVQYFEYQLEVGKQEMLQHKRCNRPGMTFISRHEGLNG